MPHIHDPMRPSNAPIAGVKRASAEEEHQRKVAMFGDLPESKKRKFILVQDDERNTRVRVRVTLDTVNMEEIPDSYRKENSVYPRSYFALQMTSPPASPGGSTAFDDEAAPENDPGFPLSLGGSQEVPLQTLEGFVKVPVPRLSKAKRSKEIMLNDLAVRMVWSQGRVFSKRTLFLQKSLDAYRNKMAHSMVAAGQNVQETAPHFQTRVGKKRWEARTERTKKARESSV
jgi:hypothetical protein